MPTFILVKYLAKIKKKYFQSWDKGTYKAIADLVSGDENALFLSTKGDNI